MDAASLWLIAAALALVGLALALVFYLGTIRVPLITGGKVRLRDIALSREAWPEREKQVSNAFDNQFQLPVIFYFLTLVALSIGATWYDAVLGWAFVLSRYVHAGVFITSNNVPRRFWVYTVGLLILTVFFLMIVVQVIAVAFAFGVR